MPVLEIYCITASVDTGSIAFHTRLGFERADPAGDYDGPGEARVAFKKKI